MSELAWAAGFFDGEGCTSVHTSRKSKYLCLQVVQQDVRPLRRFAEAVCGGKVYGPYKSQHGMHIWNARGALAHRVLDSLWPHLSEPKREQAMRVKEALNV